VTLVCLLVALLVSPARAQEPHSPATEAFRAALARMKSVSDALTEYEHTFYKREWIGGSLDALQVIDVRYREPWDIYMHWLEGGHAGRELLYRGPDWNGGRFVIDPGPFLPVLSLSPDSRLARRRTRHPLHDLPLPVLVDKVVRDALAVANSPTLVARVVDDGPAQVRSEPSHCFTTVLPKDQDRSLYANKVKICQDPDTGMPNAIRVWDEVDGSLQLVEQYDYIGFRSDPGFTDADLERTTYGL